MVMRVLRCLGDHTACHLCAKHRVRARRDFLLANYAELKKANPTFPILVRESAGVEAKLTARYGACLRRMRAPKHSSLLMHWRVCRTFTMASISAPHVSADLGVEKSVSVQGESASGIVSKLQKLISEVPK
jgi:hypothetical protein